MFLDPRIFANRDRILSELRIPYSLLSATVGSVTCPSAVVACPMEDDLEPGVRDDRSLGCVRRLLCFLSLVLLNYRHSLCNGGYVGHVAQFAASLGKLSTESPKLFAAANLNRSKPCPSISWATVSHSSPSASSFYSRTMLNRQAGLLICFTLHV